MAIDQTNRRIDQTQNILQKIRFINQIFNVLVGCVHNVLQRLFSCFVEIDLYYSDNYLNVRTSLN